MARAVTQRQVLPVAVLSGNRNFPGRVHPDIEAGFLASPPLVVAYALAGDVDRNILRDPIGIGSDRRPVYLADIWPTGAEIDAAVAAAADAGDYARAYDDAADNRAWRDLNAPATALFPWDPASTYIRRPPFAADPKETRLGHYVAHPLLVLGDDITTDHISPAGPIAARSEAADYLVELGEDRQDLNVFASRRGNWEVMRRGLFTNKSVRNLLGPAIPPGSTIHAGTAETLPLWRAAERYRQEGASLVVVAGERYGPGSSRDWAAKGLGLLGVRAALALSFERIHRSNLVGMGILPLLLPPDCSPAELALTPGDRIEVTAAADDLRPGQEISVVLHRWSGKAMSMKTIAAVETNLEADTLRAGGIIPFMLRRVLAAQHAAAGLPSHSLTADRLDCTEP